MDVDGAARIADAALEAAAALAAQEMGQRAVLGASMPGRTDGAPAAAAWERRDPREPRWFCPARGMSLPDGHPLCPCGSGRPDCPVKGQGKGAHSGEMHVNRARLAALGEELERADQEVARTHEGLLLACCDDADMAALALGVAQAARKTRSGRIEIVACILSFCGVALLPDQAERQETETAALPSRRDRRPVRPARRPVAAIVGAAIGHGVATAERLAARTVAAAVRVAEVADGFAETVGASTVWGRHARRAPWRLA